MSKYLSIATAKLRPDQNNDIFNLRFPRVDYIELQDKLNARTLDYSAYDRSPVERIVRKAETQLRSDFYLGMLSWWVSRKHSVAFTWSERAGIPFSFFQRAFPSKCHFINMFQCWSGRQELVITKMGLLTAMDAIIVHCKSMKENLVRLGAAESKVHKIHYSIDQLFFSPLPDIEPQKDLIVSIGEARSRNYPALFAAVADLPIKIHLPAYGHWYARAKRKTVKAVPPANVSLTRHLSPLELKEFYARALFAVIPVRNLVYSAGATATLEANCMARPVIAFHAPGISDYIIDGETGILVEPDDVNALREAIRSLLANPAKAKRMGENARQRIVDEFNFETYVNGIINVLMKYG
jgi:glycosyltransferase involved in cell wall biosynthesis